MEKLVETVTRMIMERLGEGKKPRVVAFGEIPKGLLCGDAEVTQGQSAADIEGCDYILLSAESFRALHGSAAGQCPTVADSPAAAEPVPQPRGCIDLTGKRLIHERDLRDQNARSGDVVRVSRNAIITALAHDYAKGIGAKIAKE